MIYALVLFVVTLEPKTIDDPRVLADKYLAALSDGHDQSGKDYLFGGLTLDAVTANALFPEITGQGAKRSEDGKLEEVGKLVAELDAQGTLTTTLSEAQAQMVKTKAARKTLMSKAPVFSDVIRADRALYWNPKNPMRVLMREAGGSGAYHIDYIAFGARSKDSSGKTKSWPLRIIRIRTDKADSGWRVLAASEWDPE